MDPTNFVCKSAACLFDKTTTPGILAFEIFIILGALLSIFLFSKVKAKAISRFLILALGVFIFEFFTNPLWMNYHLGKLAYVYQDVSWTLTLGWSAIVFFAMFLVEKYYDDYTEIRKFILTLTFVTIFGLLGETAVVNLGIRTYSPEVKDIISGLYLPGLNIPLAAFYYIPVFMALVIIFYKFWSTFLDHKVMAPFNNMHWPRKLGISLVAILLFEIMVDPMLINTSLPSWSYIYRDISLLMTGGWIVIIWSSILVIDKIFPYINAALKFFSYVLLATIITLPIEAILVAAKIREYPPSTVENFSELYIPGLNIPVEAAFAIMFYLILIMSFMYYWTYYYNKLTKK